ncbi:hypothetical protein JKP88DRAFT_263800 [Tribonema minus]|uniref:Uncharacterized protein n=1 Tax=Tribonema minus TaxID=303371 RepID=A0A835YSN7_9STRA|nr:hypothetical protein JKP88DRAFT_263800 [Tribonema minus]
MPTQIYDSHACTHTHDNPPTRSAPRGDRRPRLLVAVADTGNARVQLALYAPRHGALYHCDLTHSNTIGVHDGPPLGVAFSAEGDLAVTTGSALLFYARLSGGWHLLHRVAAATLVTRGVRDDDAITSSHDASTAAAGTCVSVAFAQLRPDSQPAKRTSAAAAVRSSVAPAAGSVIALMGDGRVVILPGPRPGSCGAQLGRLHRDTVMHALTFLSYRDAQPLRQVDRTMRGLFEAARAAWRLWPLTRERQAEMHKHFFLWARRPDNSRCAPPTAVVRPPVLMAESGQAQRRSVGRATSLQHSQKDFNLASPVLCTTFAIIPETTDFVECELRRRLVSHVMQVHTVQAPSLSLEQFTEHMRIVEEHCFGLAHWRAHLQRMHRAVEATTMAASNAQTAAPLHSSVTAAEAAALANALASAEGATAGSSDGGVHMLGDDHPALVYNAMFNQQLQLIEEAMDALF